MSRIVIDYAIKLEEPVLLTGLEGDPNSSVSYDFIPGSVLRGVFIGRDGRISDANDENKKRLFFNETSTQFLNGHLAIQIHEQGTMRRSDPVPLSWKRPKYPSDQPNQLCQTDVYDLAIQKNDAGEKSVGGWWSADSHCVYRTKPKRRIAVHTTRNRQAGRAKGSMLEAREEGEIEGAVFRYESLAKGQTFYARIICDSSDEATIKGWFGTDKSFTANIGGSRSGGYGRVEISLITTAPYAHQQPASYKNGVVVTLLSDLLLRDDKTGNWSGDPQDVCTALGLGSATEMFVDMRPIGGFNRKWGLPLPQKVAFRAGSVFVFDNATLPVNASQLIEKGIGCQRNEGFGRVAFNLHTKSTWNKPLQPFTATISIPNALSDDSDSQNMAKTIMHNLISAELDAIVVQEANGIRFENKMSRSQLGRLRLKIQDTIRNSELFNVDEWADNVNKRSVARKQYQSTKVGNKPLLNWLEQTVNADEIVGQSNSFITKIPSIGGVQPTLSHQLVTQTNQRIVNAVLKRMQKEAKDE